CRVTNLIPGGVVSMGMRVGGSGVVERLACPWVDVSGVDSHSLFTCDGITPLVGFVSILDKALFPGHLLQFFPRVPLEIVGRNVGADGFAICGFIARLAQVVFIRAECNRAKNIGKGSKGKYSGTAPQASDEPRCFTTPAKHLWQIAEVGKLMYSRRCHH